MARVVEFQTARDVRATDWETQCRFVLIDGTVRAVYVHEQHTSEEVDELLAEVEDISGVTPADGEAFLIALGDYDDGSRFARMTAPRDMDRKSALSVSGLVAVEGDDDAEAGVEIIGRLVREAVALVSQTA